MFFTNIRHSVIKNAVRIIYGKLVNVSESDAKRVSSFLKMLQVQFKMVSLTENTLESMSSDREQVVEKFCKNLDVAGKAEEIVAKPTETATAAHHEPMQDISCDWTQTTTDWDRVESIL